MTSNVNSGRLADACTDVNPGIPLLAMAYPEFTIGAPWPGRNGPTWAAVRKDASQPGLYAVVTPDLAELRAVLACQDSQRGGAGEPGVWPSAPQESHPA